MSSLNTSDVLSGVSSGLSAYASMTAAESRADQAEFEATQKAKDLEVQTEAERSQAQQKQEKLNERLQDVLAQQEAVRSASGVAMGSGSPETAREQAQADAADAKQRVADNFALQRIERESQIDQLGITGQARGSMLRSQGKQSAFQTVAGFGGRMVNELERRKEADDDIGEVPSFEEDDDAIRDRSGRYGGV